MESWYGHALKASLSGFRHYFNRPYARAIVDRVEPNRRSGYAERVLAYSAKGQLQAVLDEYAFLLAGQETGGAEGLARGAVGVLEGMTRVLSLGVGTPRVRVRASRQKHGRPWINKAFRSHFALAFADDSAEEGGGRGRRRHTREAFNSPFWPFVLATTSVGQEGLDFHWYCRDVVHWNLTSNPVDLEQREGRVNRRDGLVVRRSVAQDVPLRSIRLKSDSVWSAAFRSVEAKMAGSHHDRHGLFPHWLYESPRRMAQAQRIRRHLFHYSGSRDHAKYERLKTDLALYRLVFGQANQEDLLARLRETAARTGARPKHLEGYMLNLAPFKKGFAWRAARSEAHARLALGDFKWIRALRRDAEKLLVRHGHEIGSVAQAAGRKVVSHVGAFLTKRQGQAPTALVKDAVAALVYLRNPYDDRFDIHRTVGFADDAERLRAVGARIRTGKKSAISQEAVALQPGPLNAEGVAAEPQR
jgi:hypothetical protein